MFNLVPKQQDPKGEDKVSESDKQATRTPSHIDLIEEVDSERFEQDPDQEVPKYKLRAQPAAETDYDWVRAPQFFDEEQISQLTNEQIKTTLDYFSKTVVFFSL